MATPVLAKGKRRYSLSLTEANVERFQQLAKGFGMPPNQMSLACDDAIREMADLFQTAKDSGKFTVKDLFTLIGKQMELIMEEERREKNDDQDKR